MIQWITPRFVYFGFKYHDNASFYANMAEKICSLITCRCVNFHRANFESRFRSPSLKVKKFSLRRRSARLWIVLLFHYKPTKIAPSCVYVKTKSTSFIAGRVRTNNKRIFDSIFSWIVIERHGYQDSLKVEMTKKSKIAIQSCATY